MKSQLLHIIALVFCSLLLRELNVKQNKRMLLQNKTSEFCQGVASGGVLDVTDAELSAQATAKNTVQSIFGAKNSLDQYLTDKNTTELGRSLIMKSGPWVIMFVLSLLGWFCYCYCCCVDSCCPKILCCCKRDYEKKPLTKCESKCPQMVLIIFGVSIVVCSIIGISLASSVSPGLLSVRCSLMTLLDSTQNGQTVNNVAWVGIAPLINRLNLVKTNLQAEKNNIASTFSAGAQSFMQTDLDALKAQNAAIYTDNNSKQFPNPSASASVGSQITPLGMTTTLQTSTQAITTAYGIFQTMVDTFTQLSTKSNAVSTAADSITTALDASHTAVNTFKDSLNNQLDTLSSGLEPIGQAKSYIDLAFFTYFAVTLAFGGFPAIIIVLIMIFNFKKLRVFLHLSWCIICILMILGFLFSIAIFPLTIFVMEFCEIYDKIISTQAGFTSYPQYISTDITDKLTTCLFANGDMMAQFNIQSQMSSMNDMAQQFTAFNGLTTPGHASYIDFDQFTTQLTNQANTWTSFKIGYPALNGNGQTIPDSSATDDSNPVIALNNLNQKTDLNACTGFYDNFVFDASKCKTGYTPWTGAQGTDNNVAGSKYCIKIADFSQIFSTNRYTSCTDVVQISTMINNLKAWDADKTTKYNAVIGTSGSTGNTWEGQKTKYLQYKANFLTYITSIQTLGTGINTLLEQVGSPTTGLFAGLNCLFIKQNVRNVYNSICVAFNTPLYFMSVFIIVDSMLLFIMSYYAYSVGTRLSKKDAGDVAKEKKDQVNKITVDQEMAKLNIDQKSDPNQQVPMDLGPQQVGLQIGGLQQGGQQRPQQGGPQQGGQSRPQQGGPQQGGQQRPQQGGPQQGGQQRPQQGGPQQGGQQRPQGGQPVQKPVINIANKI